MAKKYNLSVSGDVTPIGKGTKIDFNVKNRSENLGGQGGIFADSYDGKGGRLTGVYKKESTKFETTIQGKNFTNIGDKINVQHEGETWRGHAAISGDNNGSRGGQVHGNYINGNTTLGAQYMGCTLGNIYNDPVYYRHARFDECRILDLGTDVREGTDAFRNHSTDSNIINLKAVVDNKLPAANVPHLPPPPPDPPNPNI